MEKEVQIAFAKNASDEATLIANLLYQEGFAVSLSDGFVNNKSLVIIVMNLDTTKEDLLESNPWIEDQFEFSSFRGFRVLPLIAFDMSEHDIEKEWDDGIGQVIEEIFSGEFKPYGFDLSNPNTLKELLRIIEENYQE